MEPDTRRRVYVLTVDGVERYRETVAWRFNTELQWWRQQAAMGDVGTVAARVEYVEADEEAER